MKLDFVLYDESLALVVNLLGELGGDSVMGSCVLNNETLITLHTLENRWLLYSPFSNVSPLLIFVGAFGILLSMRWLPPGLPVVCELLNKVTLDGGRLSGRMSVKLSAVPGMKGIDLQ